MKRHVLGALVLVFAPVGFVTHTASPSYATHSDIEPNNSCATAAPTPGVWETGHLSSTDTSDFYKLYANANQRIHVEMNPGYQTTTEFDLYLYNPSCVLVASSTYPGSIETINTYAVSSGNHYVEVRRVVGTGYYDTAMWASNQSPKSCSAEATALIAICSVTSPVCAAGTCVFYVSIHAEGVPTATGSMSGVSCGPSALECSGSGYWTSTTYSDACVAQGAALVKVSCEIRLV